MARIPAVVLCEGHFGDPSGKTAHGLVRYSDLYQVVAVLDSTLAGKDAGEFLDGKPAGIPIVASLEEGLRRGPATHFVVGLAPDGGKLPPEYRAIVADALRRGMHVASGLHEKLEQDAEFAALAKRHGGSLKDVRTVPPKEEQHFFTGKIEEVTCPVIAVLGTDSAIGKRTTARVLVKALNEQGYRAVFVGTGQTGRLQGAKYSIILDSLVNDFLTGEIEHVVWSAWKNESPDVIVVEGQGGLTHPGYPGGYEIICGARVKGVVLQHAPGRKTLDGFPQYPMGDPARDVAIAETLSGHPLVAITINHENLSREDVEAWKKRLRDRFGKPVTDVLLDGPQPLVDAVVERFGLEKRG
ncbi:MAG TPA: DUF1611 domain-containing protein [Candidatus Thermoplasmatota archaeon]|nr:DUF1611 domain-containing protein [Candidatus Thermoplasmatota archaeon]